MNKVSTSSSSSSFININSNCNDNQNNNNNNLNNSIVNNYNYIDRVQNICNHIEVENCSSNNNNNSNRKMISNNFERVAIVSYVRTPMGGFNGSLASLSATELASIAIRKAIENVNHPKLVESIDEVLLGNVLSANVGQAPATQAALGAGIPDSVPCTAVNKVCASGMKAVMLGVNLIQTDCAKVIVAGGFESMSNVPYYLTSARNGYRMGHQQMIDGMIKDGLTDPFGNFHMGLAAERCSKDYSISKQEQDEYALNSYRRAQEATKNGWFNEEIVPITIPGTKAKPATVVSTDDEVSNANFEKLGNLQPSFQKENGTVTAGNASTISDGASILILMSESKAKEMGVPVIAYILGMADAAQEPIQFTTAPALAIPKALSKAGISQDQVDYYEINEAFSVVALANMKKLNIPHSKINVFGGAVSMGHPLGSSGSRIICTLLSVLKQRGGKIGVASICNGGGGASAIVISRE
ncbi:hypothetical protein PPL_06349 [Heterostelium album PN500]|uniref:acetyl-CoA C-acetyltransferase n=1 Tax=Heterostelium pallidum (strain ATCC 26659 / Pp 5 / PN500) TaxID=670386 RepID=D3BCX1_HETP5|nr:hypothetical protein PPL_06349 [Heterostelium album PN500]EFA80763.1 hypothetical protein PPL_06349 [Heterostelium album PN500]|eukprot:XP_020432882.1 hypothetical protein PPL_06349 [Heterostelium album PN500]